MPAAVGPKFSAGNVNAGLVPTVMRLHPPAVLGGVGGRAADELDDGRRRGHREPADARPFR